MKNTNDDRFLITPAEAGAMLGLTGNTVRLLIKEGKLNIPHIWSGRSLKIFDKPWQQFCENGEYNGKNAIED